MSTTPGAAPRRSDFPAAKVIYCILPDDGTDRRLLLELRKKKSVVRAGSEICRAVGALAATKTKRGKLPEPQLAKKVQVVCTADQADEIFDFIFWAAKVGKPGRGLMWQLAVSSCTPYELPADIRDEEAGA